MFVSRFFWDRFSDTVTCELPDFYPQVRASMNSIRSWRLRHPRQMLIIPGSPSPFRPRNPPNRALIPMALPIDSGTVVLILSFFAETVRTSMAKGVKTFDASRFGIFRPN